MRLTEATEADFVFVHKMLDHGLFADDAAEVEV
jgi:hypothetical protein